MAQVTPAKLLLVMLGLTGFAITQPVLSVLGDEPSFFAFRNIEGIDLAWFALALAVVPALAVWLATLACRAISETGGAIVNLFFIASLTTLALVQLLKASGLEGSVLTGGLALLGGVGVAEGYRRFEVVRSWAQLMAVLPLVAVVLFLFGSTTAELLRPPQDAEQESGIAPGSEPPADVANVVLVVLDELPTQSILDPNRNIDRARFPHLARFAEDATWYRDHTTVAANTTNALPAILTGRDPTGDAATAASFPDNLFTLLEATHHLSVFESATEMCNTTACGEGPPGAPIETPPPRYRDLFDATVELWRDRISLAEESATSMDDFEERVVEYTPTADEDESDPFAKFAAAPLRLIDFIDTFTPGADPTFHFLHLLLPHVPWIYYEDGSRYTAVGAQSFVSLIAGEGEVSFTEWDLAVMEQRHLLQAQYADGLIGLVMERLRELGMYDDALIVVVSDHGISFSSDAAGPRSVADVGRQGVAYAPLLVKEPGQSTGQMSDENVLAVDVLPSIADVIGVPVPWTTDGSAVGSAAIDARGTAKYIYESRGFSQIGERVEFDTHETPPDTADRWIGPFEPGQQGTDALYEPIDLDDSIGRRLDDLLVDGTGGLAAVQDLDRIENPDGTQLGLVAGLVEDGPDDGLVLIAVDDVVVAASPLYEAGDLVLRFNALLPSGTLDGPIEVRMAIGVGGEYHELELTEA